MPRAKTSKETKPKSKTAAAKVAAPKTKKAVSTSESEVTEQNISTPSNVSEKAKSYIPFVGFKPTRVTYIVIVILALIALAFYKKSWIIAATVNGQPITNFVLIDRMNQQFRTQTLTQMVNEKVIMDEARKNGVSVSNTEINDKISQLEGNVGGAQALDSLLSQQGQTRANLTDQIRIQLSIEKLYGKDATISADEVNKFIEQNKDQLQASDSAGQIKEATDILKQQKLSQIFREKFQQLKQAAKVQIF